MALNVATLPLILCRQVKTIQHGCVRINILHVTIPCFLNFCSAVPTCTIYISNDFSTCIYRTQILFCIHVSYWIAPRLLIFSRQGVWSNRANVVLPLNNS